MKNRILSMVACLLCLCACDTSTEKELAKLNEELIPVQFTIGLQKEIIPFTPTTRSIPDFEIPEPMPQHNDDLENPSNPDNLPFNSIEYLVFQDQDGNLGSLVKKEQITTKSPSFPIIHDKLPRGNYIFCFLAHSCNDIEITENTANFPKITDTFHHSFSLTISAGEKVKKEVVLQRIISKIEFISTDAVPLDQKDFTISTNKIFKKIDLLTGNGISDNKPYTQTYIFKEEDRGKKAFSHSIITFVPQEEAININLKATSLSGETTREHTINDVKPIRNHIIRYTGILYTPKVSTDAFTIVIQNGGKWDTPVDHELQE